jgi:inner membrane protein
MAAGVGLLTGLLGRRWRVRFASTALLAALTMASHGVLDTFTDGGGGIALLWPFSSARFFSPWRPIPVAPVGRYFLSAAGLRVAATETLASLPLLVYAFWPRRRARAATPAPSERDFAVT